MINMSLSNLLVFGITSSDAVVQMTQDMCLEAHHQSGKMTLTAKLMPCVWMRGNCWVLGSHRKTEVLPACRGREVSWSLSCHYTWMNSCEVTTQDCNLHESNMLIEWASQLVPVSRRWRRYHVSWQVWECLVTHEGPLLPFSRHGHSPIVVTHVFLQKIGNPPHSILWIKLATSFAGSIIRGEHALGRYYLIPQPLAWWWWVTI